MEKQFFVQMIFAGTSRVFDLQAENPGHAICEALDMLAEEMPAGSLAAMPSISIVAKPAQEGSYMTTVEQACISARVERFACAA